ncbi:hypothetical protein QTP88_014836 [Uroleucon formosanum]
MDCGWTPVVIISHSSVVNLLSIPFTIVRFILVSGFNYFRSDFDTSLIMVLNRRSLENLKKLVPGRERNVTKEEQMRVFVRIKPLTEEEDSLKP